jgi:azurin
MIDLEGAATDIQCAEQQKYDTNEHRVRHACRMNHLQEAYWGKRPNEVSTVPHTPLTPGQSQAGQHCHGVGTHPFGFATECLSLAHNQEMEKHERNLTLDSSDIAIGMTKSASQP